VVKYLKRGGKMDKVTDKKQRAVLVGLCCDIFNEDENSGEVSLDELSELLKTAGGECVCRVIQNLHTPDTHTFIGSGKVQEIKDFIQNNDIDLVVFDNDLSPSQTRALNDELGVMTIDRSNLILDIFAQRASTREGRLQVELAQYKYLLPRLSGMWKHLVRQTASGGKSPIGTRGPGETQLETDRRHIRRKIQKLEEEIEDVKRARATSRAERLTNEIPQVALVGYTNSGKSTILNLLTDAGIHAADRLFDTLDTTTRKLKISDNLTVLLSDTVGFIRRLPHHLVEAFSATLEELKFADLILHVVDVSSDEALSHIEVTERLITKLGAEKTPSILVCNKIDKLPETPCGFKNAVYISALKNEGIDTLLNTIEKKLLKNIKRVTYLLPYSSASSLDSMYKTAKVENVSYEDTGIRVVCVCDDKMYGRLRDFVVCTEDI